MSAQPKASEPSMEEILASIRRIIADDQVKPAAPATAPEPQIVAAAPLPPRPAPVAVVQAPEPVVEALDLGIEASPAEDEPQSQDDIDLLFNEVIEAAPEPEPEPVFAPPPVQYIPPAIPEPVAAAVPAMVVEAPAMEAPVVAPSQLDMSALISAQAGGAVSSAFGALAHTVLSNNARTLEDLVQDMLKPMLKSWLDENLPSMVERLVRAEIERVARSGRT